MTTLLPTAYLGPIQYYLILANQNVLIEHWEHYQKQTYRNRCAIYDANGKLNLVIPVQHEGKRVIIKEVKICNVTSWQKLHWRSIQTAYRSSPYFEYYEDDFAPFFTEKYEYLINFNETIQNTVLKLLGLEIKSKHTTSYQTGFDNIIDLRNHFSPNLEPLNLPATLAGIKLETNYTQVFENKLGFIPNLSIIDLLFNQGPSAIKYLREDV